MVASDYLYDAGIIPRNYAEDVRARIRDRRKAVYRYSIENCRDSVLLVRQEEDEIIEMEDSCLQLTLFTTYTSFSED